MTEIYAALADYRFTPTCVGNTNIFARSCGSLPVHPHMRGEYGELLLSHQFHGGSPPHAWGIRRSSMRRHLRGRFTPTCVGNTECRLGITFLSTVHPHMRGEYSGSRLFSSARSGSPPHAWGILLLSISHLPPYRFTPTCVGNTIDHLTRA